MPRKLDEKDLKILKKLAPECESIICNSSDHEFHSILPPLSNHIVKDGRDFQERISRLSKEELEYIVSHIIDGTESLGCIPPEDIESLIAVIGEKVSRDAAEQVMNIYNLSDSCVLDAQFES